MDLGTRLFNQYQADFWRVVGCAMHRKGLIALFSLMVILKCYKWSSTSPIPSYLKWQHFEFLDGCISDMARKVGIIFKVGEIMPQLFGVNLSAPHSSLEAVTSQGVIA